jgi:hypothetical protein
MNFSFTRWNCGYHGAFQELFFTRWNFGCHGAFSNFHEFFLTMESRLLGTFLKLSRIFSYDGIQAITEPFSNFHKFFLMMEPFTNFFTRWNFGYNIALSLNVSFTLRNFSYHRALSWNHSPHLEILETYELGGNSFHK